MYNLEWCAELGDKPEKSFSGDMRVCMYPDLHEQLPLDAEKQGISVNALINKKLEKA